MLKLKVIWQWSILINRFIFVIAGRVWKDYFRIVDSIVFLVDTTDRCGFSKTKAELDVRILFFVLFYILKMILFFSQSLLIDEQVADVPIVILATKIDLPEAVSEERLGDILGISSATTEKVKEKISLHINKYFCQGTVDHMNINSLNKKVLVKQHFDECPITQRTFSPYS